MKSRSKNTEMTRYAFIEHMKDYMKELLNNPLKADTDDFLHSFGIDGPSALKMLLKRTDPNDEYSAIILRNERIKDNGFDENGNRKKDTFEIKYKIPRKDFKKKLRNLYINLFERNIIDGSLINEDINMHEMPLSSTPSPFKDKSFGKVQSQCVPGSIGDRFAQYVNDNEKEYEPKLFDDKKENLTEGAWGYDILDNDTAIDFQTEFAEIALNVLCSKVYNSLYENSDNFGSLWANIGVLTDFLKKYKDEEIQTSDKFTYAIMLVKNSIRILFNNDDFVNSWSEPKKIRSSLKKVLKDVSLLEYQKDIMNDKYSPLFNINNQYKNSKLNEDGEGSSMEAVAGSTNSESSGQFITPLFGKPIKRKSIYLTQEQIDYIKEATANVGNYQYDMPIQNDNDFYKEANNHKNILKDDNLT